MGKKIDGRMREKFDSEISQMALSIFDRVRSIKAENPDVAKRIDRLEVEIRERMQEIRTEIDKLDGPDKDLVTILVINGIHREADDTFVD